LVEAEAVGADIVLLLACWFAVLTTCVFMLYIFIFLSWINFLAMKMSKINQKYKIGIKIRMKIKYYKIYLQIWLIWLINIWMMLQVMSNIFYYKCNIFYIFIYWIVVYFIFIVLLLYFTIAYST
jgi:hypothetical protein